MEKMLPIEEWRTLIYYGVPTRYAVSSIGRVKSLQRFGNGYTKEREHILSQSKVGNYCVVTIYINKKPIQEYVHRLVAMMFIPVPQELLDIGYTMETLEVNHILSGVEYKDDNRAVNLEWVTGSGNKKHDYNTGIRNRGEDSHLATKNTEAQIHNVCKLLEENIYTVTEISSITGVATGEVYDILYGGSWVHISSKYELSKYTPKNKKYSDKIIDQIRKLLYDGVSMKDISSKLNIGYKSVSYIKNNYIKNQ